LWISFWWGDADRHYSPGNDEAILKFYLTFGQCSPLKNGFIIVRAHDFDEARDKVVDQFGQKWSGLYFEDDWEPEFYPEGCKGILL
jgi:hypothetical protein